MSEEGKFATCIYKDKKGNLQYEHQYICMYKDIHKDRVYTKYMLNSTVVNVVDILSTITNIDDILFLSSYQVFKDNNSF